MENWWAYALGYVFSLGGNFFLVRPVMDTLWREFGWKGDPTDDPIRPFAWHVSVLGCLEAALYTSSWLVGKPEFIAVWLAFKVAGQWGRWSKDLTTRNGTIPGRSFYNVFLIGNGLSISYAVTGAKVVEWVIGQKFAEAVIVPSILVAGTLCVWNLIDVKIRKVKG